MAEPDPEKTWFTIEDGCLALKDQIENIVYHPSLNVLLIISRGAKVSILDITSGTVYHSIDLSADTEHSLQCTYLVSQDRIVFASDFAVGARKDLNGMLLLESVLQLPISCETDIVRMELPLPDAVYLHQSLSSSELPGAENVEQVVRELWNEIEAARKATKYNHKVAKWATVCVKQAHNTLKTVFTNLLTEMKRLQQKVPALPIVSGLLDQLNNLSQSEHTPVVTGPTVDRTLMYNESARRDTFVKWPHLNYKWALPDPMAQAGFYYQPSTVGDDRAMCFTCNVCLVCWEPTDEPWSEHERHSPQCPFVKGEYTQNVPVSVTYATEPARLHGDKTERIECISASTSNKYLATSTIHGNVVIWNTSSQLKKHASFNIDLNNPNISSKTGVYPTGATVVTISLNKPLDKESSAQASEETTADQIDSQKVKESGTYPNVPSDSTSATTEVKSSMPDLIPEPSIQITPSTEVFVTALSILDGSSTDYVLPQGSSRLSARLADHSEPRPCLVAGISILTMDRRDVGAAWPENQPYSEVQALNKLNQAISGEVPSQQIIQPDNTNKDGSPTEKMKKKYISCLVVYDVATATARAAVRDWKTDGIVFPGTKVVQTEYSSGIGSLSSTLHNPYMVKDMDMSDDDQEVQIIGITHNAPVSPTLPKIINMTPFDPLKSDSSSPGKSTPGREANVKDASDSSADSSSNVSGKVLQCILLPKEVGEMQYIRSIVSSTDGSHVLVVTSPIHLHDTVISNFSSEGSCESDASCLILYRVIAVKSDTGVTTLEPDLTRIQRFDKLDEAVISVAMLPLDACQLSDEEDEPSLPGGEVQSVFYHQRAAAFVTYGGDIKIISLVDLSTLAHIKCMQDDKFISVTFCSGIDRLCACTQTNRLKFFVIGPRQRHMDEVDDSGAGFNPSLHEHSTQKSVLLTNQRQTVDVLKTLHRLTQFENLLPRFSVTIPPCWVEIQQEQQQRKHPQHLHQQGEAAQHTRTWRLQQDSNSWDEHLFELVLPKPCCVGHIDLKFTLSSLCTVAPSIKVTLLKQSISNQKMESVEKDASQVEPDSRVDFNLHNLAGTDQDQANCRPSDSNGKVLDSSYFEKFGAEVVCGPMELTDYVDLSGIQGTIPLTSVKLIKTKSKSFLLHFKSQKVKDKPVNKQNIPKVEKSMSNTATVKQSVPVTSAVGGATVKTEIVRGCDWLQEISITVRKFHRANFPRDRLQRIQMLESLNFHDRLVESACGHDDLVDGCNDREHRRHLALDILIWIMTIQMNDAKKEGSKQESSLLWTLQSKILPLVQTCLLQGDRSIAHKCAKLIAVCLEYVKNCNDPDIAPSFNFLLLQSLVESLPMIVISTSAGALHWFFTLLNHVKCMDVGAAGEKCSEILGQISRFYSSRVNPYHSLLRTRFGLYGSPLEPDLFDIDPPTLRTAPATSYAGMVAGSYTGGTSANISSAGMLGGMSGLPFPGGMGGMGGMGGLGGMGGMGGMTGVNSGVSTGSSASSQDEVVFKDLMSLCSNDKSSGVSTKCDQLSRYLTGLIEVEPLHFTCHATSDGTRMERMDSNNQSVMLPGNTSGLSGTVNFGETLSMGPGSMMHTYSSAMMSAEHQLQQLQHKQLQLMKLQQQKQKLEQKLVETSKNAAMNASSSLSHYVPYASELFPPTPKNTPFFMTPPVTPPNETFHSIYVGGVPPISGMEKIAEKPPTGKVNSNQKSSIDKNEGSQPYKLGMLWPQTQNLFQPPPAQALVIERMHSGARRFVILDFGKPILLTDVIIPMCGDLASLSIDIWVHSEEIDGHRLVVLSDIGVNSLIMNDIMPPPVCRYLKITTIRRYGGNTTRSKIPIGTFYGHTFILPWERERFLPALGADNTSDRASSNQPTSLAASDHSQILAQLGIYSSLLEEVQCRYNLACRNLTHLLSNVDSINTGSNHFSNFFLKKGKRTEDDNKIYQAYYECIQLQVQLNLAKNAITRLQKVLGICCSPVANFDQSQSGFLSALKQSSVDKLRVLIEFLLDTVLSMTNSCPTIPQIPMSLYATFTPAFADALFKNLCIYGTKKMQTHAGVILVRICGNLHWWGDFLGSILEEFFASDQPVVFPQDRVFILLAALGQRSLTGPAAASILESILVLLSRLLSPLILESHESNRGCLGMLDLSLISWLLLFLSKSLDSINSNNTEDNDKASAKDKEGKWCLPPTSSRWNFIQGEGAMQTSKMSKNTASKLCRRKLQKRLMHHKQQLLDFQQKKHLWKMEKVEKPAAAAVGSGGLLDKETEHLIKTQECLIKRQLKQSATKHLYGSMRKAADGESSRKPTKDDRAAHSNLLAGDRDAWDMTDGGDLLMAVSREKCIPVVKGLVTLLLSMDFTCHVDLFIIACKVLARIMCNTRPVIPLSEALNQEDLEKLLLLMCSMEYNTGNVSWGGSWASHVITCLLQDILEGERLYMTNVGGDQLLMAANNGQPSMVTDMDESLMNSCTLPTMDEDMQTINDTSVPDVIDVKSIAESAKFDAEMSMLVDALMEEDLIDENSDAKYDLLSGDPLKNDWPSMASPKLMNITMKSLPNSNTIHWGYPPTATNLFGMEDKKDFKNWKIKMANYSASKTSNNVVPHGISLAMDARLEQGLELGAELRLKVMLAMEAQNIQSAVTAPLPTLAPGVGIRRSNLPADIEDQQGANLTNSGSQETSSNEMLSLCFSNLFMQLPQGRVSLDILLQTWLTLNDDMSLEDSGMTFEPSRVPTIPLDQDAIHSLLLALANAPTVSIRTWVLAFQSLTLMANLKGTDDRGQEDNHPIDMVSDPNLMTVLGKFLSGTGQPQSSLAANSQNNKVGPAVVRSFHDFLVRLQLQCLDYERLKEICLRLVNTLASEGGSFHLFLGPLDAQCKFLDDLITINFDRADINLSMSIIESISSLVHRHLMSQERVYCRSSTENCINARSCFGGLFANLLRDGDSKSTTGDCSRDQLMCSLLKLVDQLIRIPLPKRQAANGVANKKAGGTTVDCNASNIDASGVSRNGAIAGDTAVGTVDSPQTDMSRMSQSLGASGVVMTSTPSVDEQTGVTDEQKTESARTVTTGPAPVLVIRAPRPCSHQTFGAGSESKTALLADIVLGHRLIMLNLIEAMSCCNSNTIAMILASSGLPGSIQDSFAGENPLSVGDGVFRVLCTLNGKASNLRLVIQPLFEYLAFELQGSSAVRVSRLSEPLLWFILRVLDCRPAIKAFLDMGGIEVLCHNLVSANRRVINTSPSLVSAIMQYFGSTKISNLNSRRVNNAGATSASTSDSAESLLNFAPLGTITSASPLAGPADILTQGSPPHRRARSAAWSYHFYPDEAWVDLTITLPCAILLKEVIIQPHFTSLATCPASVTLEGSRDGSNMVPIGHPMATAGMTNIKIHLSKEEVVTAVTIRLHKPRDSQTLGLSQIMLMGCLAFGDSRALKAANLLAAPEDFVSRTSIEWLRLLHHCLTHCEELQDDVTRAAAQTPDLLLTCTTLLTSTSTMVYATNIESVLLTIGLHSLDMGLGLIDHLLRNTSFTSQEGHAAMLRGKIQGKASESTVDILYQLGTNRDAGLLARIKALTEWLGDCARVALQKSHGLPDEEYRPGIPRHAVVSLPSPAVAHVHCVAVILWHNNSCPVLRSDLQNIITQDLLSSLYEWSMVLASDCVLKQAVDNVICSICYIHPIFFGLLLEWMGIVIASESCTDDSKDIQQVQSLLTDDLKADNEAREIGRHIGATPRSLASTDLCRSFLFQEIGRLVLQESHLSTLALACQSLEALTQLMDTGFVAMLCQGLYEIACRELMQRDESVLMMAEAATDLGKRMAADASASSLGKQKDSSRGLVLTADLIGPVLKFLAEISNEVVVKDWLGGTDGSMFWTVLLKYLCTNSSHVFIRPGQGLMTNKQQSIIETATVKFFSNVISCHAKNQLQFSLVLHEVIQACAATAHGCPSPLPGFLRRLLLQVLLEDEKVLVCIRSKSQMYKGQSCWAASTSYLHPRCGIGYKHRSLSISLQSTMAEIIASVSESQSLASQQFDDQEKATEDLKKDISELGIEVVDQISALTGMKAKEKPNKDKSTASRPPSRLGTRSADQSAASLQIPIMALYHSLLPGQPLPSDLTLSQLLVILQDRGFTAGQTSIDLDMKLCNQTPNDSTIERRTNTNTLDTVQEADYEETNSSDAFIPRASLLQTSHFTSALQVFSSVGGLALLAEHLPLLYPEFTRQASPVEVTKDPALSNLGHDWVTVESAEEIYEEIYEPPMPPSPPQHKPAIGPVQVLSISPHSLVAFGLFLRLPGYSEVLLKDKKKAQCLLRLVLGVTDDGEGGHILTSPIASSLPSLPFNVLKSLFDSMPLTTDDGVLLRRMTLEIGAIHLILACLSVLGHHAPRQQIPGIYQDIIKAATQATQTVSANTSQQKGSSDEKAQNYWAKGTGFGTGSTTSSWDAEHALLRQKSEEEHVTSLLQVLASYINPGTQTVLKSFAASDVASSGFESSDETPSVEQSPLPGTLPELLSQSCLVPALSSYLRNDSVLDMACHVPLYRALLELLRGLAVCPILVPLLMPLEKEDDSSISVSCLLDKMKQCVDTYANRLKGNKSKAKSPTKQPDDEESEGLALLIPDIQITAAIVNSAVSKFQEKSVGNSSDVRYGKQLDVSPSVMGRMNHTEEERYMSIMKLLQFDTFRIVTEEKNLVVFSVPHHYEANVKAAGEVNNASRARRLAQEAVTLSTSLPLSASSSVFVRCDEERLDVMKVMMTGPSDTPYANGCFEFDVYFPTDYPNSPPLINLETTGNHTVRFNPNLYNDGKVCLSILNTWHGRPEEKWNSQTSSFLQVLVSVQSLILVHEPYFNEPGYERSRGTPSGTASSREYDANIRQATVKWAMLEMLKNPPASFKSVILWHFWLKRNEILSQIEEWMTDMEHYSKDKRVGRSIAHSCVALKRHYNQLKEELTKLKPPDDIANYEDTSLEPIASTDFQQITEEIVVVPTAPTDNSNSQ